MVAAIIINNLPPPSAFTIDQNDPNKWPKWRKKFENYIIASDLDSKNYTTTKGYSITHYWRFSALKYIIHLVLKRMRKALLSKIFKINFDDFVTEIKSKAEDCEFEIIKDSLIRDRIVLGCRDTTLREKYLQNPDLTLSLAINQGQAAEASQK
ncbi:K02A2.6-like [Cordylochernes scorpioides]|uniref:K02A2.6-like n=1 Tax=Cordylochernes scorpioides TaxID=51811 RepID=A0ABY6LHA8_9ARAC|nr:K02A2.6-like [Cordylochernes scorpioides]